MNEKNNNDHHRHPSPPLSGPYFIFPNPPGRHEWKSPEHTLRVPPFFILILKENETDGVCNDSNTRSRRIFLRRQ